MPTHSTTLHGALPLTHSELRALNEICVVMEQLETPRPIPQDPLSVQAEHGRVRFKISTDCVRVSFSPDTSSSQVCPHRETSPSIDVLPGATSLH